MSRSSHKARWDKAGPALCTTVKGVSPRGTSRPSSPSSQAGNPAWSSRPRRGRPVAGHALLLRAASLGRGSRDCGAPGRRRACFPEPRSPRGSLLWEARSGPPPAPAGGPQRKCAATEASTGTSNPPPVIVGQPHGRGLSDSVWSLARTLQMQGPGAASPPGRGGGSWSPRDRAPTRCLLWAEIQSEAFAAPAGVPGRHEGPQPRPGLGAATPAGPTAAGRAPAALRLPRARVNPSRGLETRHRPPLQPLWTGLVLLGLGLA